jgi:hypothetical protein
MVKRIYLEPIHFSPYASLMNAASAVPIFRKNTSDDLHCVEACVAMILETVDPTKTYLLEDLARIAGKMKGGWTWPMRLMVWLAEQGFEVISEVGFDYPAFAADGALYLERAFGNEVARTQVAHADIDAERKAVPAFLERIKPQKTIPTLARLRELLEQGYFLMCNVNSRVIHGHSGYCGHVILIYGIDENNVYAHDPGLPAVRAKQIPIDLFERAWAFPNEDAKGVLAIKLKR